MQKAVDPAKTVEKAAVMDVFPLNCTGCLRCQMVCSLTYTGRVNPLAANIKIDRNPELLYRYQIGFTQECHSGCKLCAKHCPYESLVVKKVEGGKG